MQAEHSHKLIFKIEGLEEWSQAWRRTSLITTLPAEAGTSPGLQN